MNAEVRGASARGWLAGQWLNEETLEPLAEINHQCLELLCGMAHVPLAQQPRMLSAQPDAWRTLTMQSRLRLAASPYLLVDAGFSDETRWQAVAQRSVRDLPREFLQPAFTGDSARDFIRSVLVYGWHLARAHRQIARLVFGLNPTCAALLASLRLKDLDWLAEQQPGWVRPRWESQPAIWQHLLHAAGEDDRQVLTQVSLRGIQLLAAGLLRPAPDRRVP